ncbi:MAG: Radical SAM domain iron-sulfur cluster-binding oxidoreductase [Candidatus Magasanikbacteria bacterium GW2011_GWC2_40_17]|uniref:Radical SAM domain iron-sulfur cluster-binding oxidoreductase n=1 Tax=Candidatus Magasanikbacteria bacterium GW2011_GWA2_42_32 TaxID=1619039 RepID=A0A0G0ZZS7_9BACT|nr:MAG: Radical SAM domain iron-sulfur cluster-binding oxidoreductase [Candidatus Magasanikbacteria bacterium GW2011_GWC2_40_17]KKS54182.1 MAG: Radical SAM domain iron-sulfur cluster-binding oxidoreductase [Candidatus Magasanikbacteria bacterium GW2011_GWA2_42_32]HBX16164.1 hypothetical protein [Candidatus Magasanikbacteria bacterium]
MYLKDYIQYDHCLGVIVSGSKVTVPVSAPVRSLKYYSITSETDAIIAHNLEWARTGDGRPRFQFAYIMLPTPCNQRCAGCFMGQDKGRLPTALSGPYWTHVEMNGILAVIKAHGAKAIVYGGGGELFAWNSALGFVEQVVESGLGMVAFTNGTLLSEEQIDQLDKLGVVLIVSLRDTIEKKHNVIVGRPNFNLTLKCIEKCLERGMQTDGRLAIEMPVTGDNIERAVNDLLPVCRALGIVPWIEEFIRISASPQERAACNSFAQARAFFKHAARKDMELGVNWTPEYGQRMLDQPQCRRPLYSFAIFPSGDVMDCPSHTVRYGNIRRQPLKQILTSDRFRQRLLNFELCPCSRFYTENDNQIPRVLPAHLKENI